MFTSQLFKEVVGVVS